MAVYYIGSYDIVDPNEFQEYPPVVMALLPKYGGVVRSRVSGGQATPKGLDAKHKYGAGGRIHAANRSEVIWPRFSPSF
jgi:hypothetical protein